MRRSLAQARDGAAALNAFDGLLDKGNLVLSARSSDTIRARHRSAARRRRAHRPHPDAARRHHRLARSRGLGGRNVAARPVRLLRDRRAARQSYRSARNHIPADWTLAAGEELHTLRQRVVDFALPDGADRAAVAALRPMWIGEAERMRGRLGQCQDIEVLTRLTAPHQILAHWRSRLTPACAERSAQLAQRAARIAVRLFAERPKAFRQRLEALWEQ